MTDRTDADLARLHSLHEFVELSAQGLRLGPVIDVTSHQHLRDLMDFDHVVFSDGRGHLHEVTGLWAPTAHQWEDEHGDWSIEFEAGVWTLMDGYSGQQSYAGPWMHESEFLGGRMADDLLTEAGFYVMIYAGSTFADGSAGEADTWAVARITA